MQRFRNFGSENYNHLELKIKPINHISDCISLLQNTKNSICMMPLFYYEYLKVKFRNSDGSPTVKVSKISLYSEFMTFAFEKASPFAEKFDKILQRIVESGLPNSHTREWGYSRKMQFIGKESNAKEFKKVIFLQCSFWYF